MNASFRLMIPVSSMLLLAVGCVLPPAPQPTRGYMSPDEDVYGRSSKLESTQKSQAVVQAVERLFTDPMFTEKYGEALQRTRAAGQKRPSVTVLPLEDNSGSGTDSAGTGQMYREICNALRKSGKFEVIDRLGRSEMTAYHVAAVDGGEDPGVLAGIGSFRAADFTLRGAITRSETPDGARVVYHHNVNLEMVDSRTGTLFWSESIPFVKADWSVR